MEIIKTSGNNWSLIIDEKDKHRVLSPKGHLSMFYADKDDGYLTEAIFKNYVRKNDGYVTVEKYTPVVENDMVYTDTKSENILESEAPLKSSFTYKTSEEAFAKANEEKDALLNIGLAIKKDLTDFLENLKSTYQINNLTLETDYDDGLNITFNKNNVKCIVSYE